MLTVFEVAQRLRVSPESVRRWVRQGRMRGVHVGHQLRIPPEEVNRILSDGLDAPRAPAPSRREEPPLEDPPEEDPPASWPAYQAYREPGPERATLRIIGERG